MLNMVIIREAFVSQKFKKCENARHDKLWPKMHKSVRKMSIYAIKCRQFLTNLTSKVLFMSIYIAKKASRSSGPEHTKCTKKIWTWVWSPPPVWKMFKTLPEAQRTQDIEFIIQIIFMTEIKQTNKKANKQDVLVYISSSCLEYFLKSDL